MAHHNDLGKEGERLAETYLLEKGFSVLHRNWRHSRYEIDIIVLKNGVLHFVEVKLRSYADFGLPEESVTKKKIRFLLQAANEFLHRNPGYTDFRIDILSINTNRNTEKEFFFIEDVYL
jgi:putative endonuclease